MQNLQLSQETKVELATKMVLLDAMEKGHTDKRELIAYMKSETFSGAVAEYLRIIEENTETVITNYKGESK